MASPSAGCRRSARTRRSSSSTPARSISARRPASAALVAKINGNPIKSIYVYSRPEWTALVTRKDTGIAKVADLKGKRVAVTRGTDPHIFLVRALAEARPHREGREARPPAAPGRAPRARARRRRRLGRARPDDGLGRGRERGGAVLPQARGQHLGHPQRPRGVRQGEPGARLARAQGLRGGARAGRSPTRRS